jgi:hypothetical protein
MGIAMTASGWNNLAGRGSDAVMAIPMPAVP